MSAQSKDFQRLIWLFTFAICLHDGTTRTEMFYPDKPSFRLLVNLTVVEHYYVSPNVTHMCCTCQGNTYLNGICLPDNSTSDCRPCPERYHQPGNLTSHVRRQCKLLSWQNPIDCCECSQGVKERCSHRPGMVMCCENDLKTNLKCEILREVCPVIHDNKTKETDDETTAKPDESTGDGGGFHVGVIIGIVIGCVGIIIIVGIIIWRVVKKRRCTPERQISSVRYSAATTGPEDDCP